MIDNYLRTSLIFYDATGKQDFRKTVLENIRIPKAQLTERYRLPPFNITSTDLIGIPTVFKLYDKYTGIETADLFDPVYGGADLLSLEFDGTNYWLVYDGETKLKTAMPCGEQIVKIGDCIKIWESEIVNICGIADNIINWREKNTIGMLYDTQERGNNYGVVVGDHTVAPQMYYYNKKTYCAWLQRGGVPWNCEGMIYAIYHNNCYISESYGVGEGTIGGADPHAYPAIIVADDGYIIVAHERLTGAGYPPDHHNGYIQIKRSDNPEDETSWVNAIAHNASHWQELGNETNWRLTYPHFDKMPDGKIFLICRHSSVAELDRIVIFRSDDNGRTWNALGGDIDGGCDIVDLDLGPSGNEIYGFFAKHGNDNKLHVIVSWKDVSGDDPPYELDIWYMRSEDNGIHWTDVSNSYVPDGPLGRNITTGGNNPIPRVDLDNAAFDFVVESVAIPDYIGPRSCVVSDAEIPYILLGKGTKPAGPFPLFVYYWNGAAWANTEPDIINQLETTYIASSHLFLRPNTANPSCYEIILVNKISGIIKWRVYASNNLINWTLIYEYEWILLTDMFYMGSYTFNYINANHEALQFLVDTSPDYFDFYVRSETDCICCQGLAKPITIEYENTHDFAGILSEYKGRVHLCADIRKPDQKIIKTGKEKEGELWIQKIITQKIYRFNILCTESLIDTLTIIPSYEAITVHFDNESAEVKEFSVAPPEWKYEGLGQLEITFIVESIIKTNCDEDYSLQEELILNGDFSAWTGAYPNRNPDNWTIFETPPGEISEVAPNESHADAGVDAGEACNIFSNAGESVFIEQDILTIGEIYLIEIEITNLTAGLIYLTCGIGGTSNSPVMTTEGIHRFVKICDGADGKFRIIRAGICDITIDNVSVKLYS